MQQMTPTAIMCFRLPCSYSQSWLIFTTNSKKTLAFYSTLRRTPADCYGWSKKDVTAVKWDKTLSESRRCVTSSTSNSNYDVVIVGGGIVGMATARELSYRYPKLRYCLLEKEDKLSAHQSGHNSGVIHSGVYYTPGSLKAQLCVKGLDLVYAYCDKKRIPYKKCGKLIVAVEHQELPRLENLYERGLKNGVRDIQIVGPDKIRQIEPHCQGLRAVWCPHTGIVDYTLVNAKYAEDFKEHGGDVFLSREVTGIQPVSTATTNSESKKYPVVVLTKKGSPIYCRFVLTCGGLHSDRLSELSGCSSEPKIVPFRGEYLVLRPEKCHLIRGNIYPVPNPNFPFLGVHFTPRMDGSVWLGPNAVLAFKREGYSFGDISRRDLFDALRFRGFQKLVRSYAMEGIGEMYRSFVLSAQVKELRKYVPAISVQDVSRGPAGVRAQAMSADGKLVDDFVFDGGEGELGRRVLHVRNAPSPGATSSQAIAHLVADEAAAKFELSG